PRSVGRAPDVRWVVGGRRLSAAWRWALVVLLLCVLGALPAVLAARPAADAGTAAPALRERALASLTVVHSGYAESSGGLLLPEATAPELSRIGSRLVAGRDALGVRVRPDQPAASVGQVDVWVDRATGLPLAVEVTGRGLTQPSLTARYLDLDLSRPTAA